MSDNIGLGLEVKTNYTSLDEAVDAVKRLNVQLEQAGKGVDLNINEKEMKEARDHVKALEMSIKEAKSSGGDFGRIFERNLKEVQKESKKASTELKKVKKDANDLGGATGFQQISKSAKIATQDIRSTETQLDMLKNNLQQGIGQTLAFGAITGLQSAFSGSLEKVTKIDEVMTDISIVAGKTNAEMASYRKFAGGVADDLGSVGSEYLKASLIYEQQGGLAAQYAKDLGESTVVAANITRESTDAMSEYLTSTINGFQMLKEKGGEAGLYITDVMSKLGAASGSDLGEIAIGLSNTANIAADAKFEFEEIATAIATVSEVTRTAPQRVGNAFKAMITNFTQLREAGEDEMNKFTSKVEKAFKLAGIQDEITMFDNGNLRDASDVMGDLGKHWEKMTKESKALVSEAVAGKYQAETFTAFMNNQERYQDLLGQAYDSAGTAAQQQLVYMDSLEAHSNRFKNAWEEASSAMIDTDIFKTAIKQGTTFLKVVGAQKNELTAIGALLGPAITALGSMFGSKMIGEAVQAQQMNALEKHSEKRIKALAEEHQWSAKITEEMIKQEKAGREQQEVSKNLGREAGTAYKALLDRSKELKEEQDRTLNKEKYLEKQREQYKSTGGATGVSSDQVERHVESKVKNDVNKLNDLKLESETYKEIDRTVGTTRLALGDIAEKSKFNEQRIQKIAKHTESWREQQSKVGGLSEEVQKKTAKILELSEKLGSEANKGHSISTKQKKTIEEIKALEEEITRITKERNNESSKEVEALSQKISQTREKEKYNEVDRQSLSTMRTEEDVLAEKQYNDDKIKQLERSSRIVQRTEKTIKGMSLVIGAAPQLMATFNAAADGTLSKGDAINRSIQTIGTTLMFAGGIWTKAIGVALAGFSLVADHLDIFTSKVEKAKKINDDMIREYMSLAEKLDAELGSVQDIENPYKKFEGMDAFDFLSYVPSESDRDSYQESLEAYLDLAEKLASTNPELILGYTAEGEAIVDLSTKYEDLKSAKEQERLAKFDPLVSNLDGFAIEYQETLIGAIKERSKATRELQKGEEALKEVQGTNNAEAYKNITKYISDSNIGLGDANKTIKETKDNIQANIVSPFVEANKEVQTLKTLNREAAEELKKTLTSNFNVDKVETAIMTEGDFGESDITTLQTNLNKISEEVLRLEKETEGAGKQFAELINNGDEAGKVIALKAPIENMGELRETLESINSESSTAYERISKLVEIQPNNLGDDSFDTSQNELEDRAKSIKKSIEDVKKLMTVEDSSGSQTFKGLSKTLKEQEGMLKEVEESLSKDSGEFQKERSLKNLENAYAESTKSIKGFEEALNDVKDLDRTMSSLEDLSSGTNIEASMSVLKEMAPEIYKSISEVGPASNEAKEIVTNNLIEIGETQEAVKMAMLANDTEYYGNWLDSNSKQVDAILEGYGIDARAMNSLSELREEMRKIELERFSQADLTESEIKALGLEDRQALDDAGYDYTKESLKLLKKEFFGWSDHVRSVWSGIIGMFKGEGYAEARDKKTEQIINERIKEEGAKGTERAKKIIDERAAILARHREESQAKIDALTEASTEDIGIEDYEKRLNGLKEAQKSVKDVLEDGPKGALEKDGTGTEKEIADLDVVIDRYYKLEKQLSRINDSYNKVSKEKSQLFGKDKIRAMEEEQRLLAQQAGVLRSYSGALKGEQSELRGSLSGSGFRFDGDGQISNLNEQLKAAQNQANSLTGDAKKEAIDKVKKLQTDASRYLEITYNLIPDKEQAIRDAKATFSAIAAEKVDYTLQLRLDKSQLKLDVIDTVKEMQDTFGRLDEKTRLVGMNMSESMKEVVNAERDIASLRANTDLNEEDRNKRILDAQHRLLENVSKSRASMKELQEIQKQFINEFKEAIDEIDGRFKNIVEKSQALIDKQKELYGSSSINAVTKLYDAQEKAIDQSVNSLVRAQNQMVIYRNSLEKGNDSWKEANKAVSEMSKNIEQQLLSKVDMLKSKFEDLTESIFDGFQKAFGLFGVDGAANDIDKIISRQDKMFNGYEKLSTIGSKIAEINREIAESNDPTRSKELAEFRDKELKRLAEQEEVSKREYERAMKLYDIKLKEMAIEDRRDAKRIAQLVRDQDGNMSYEYIRQDTEDVSKDIAELEKAKNDLYEFDRDGVRDSAKEIFTIIEEYQSKLGELKDKGLSPEDYKKQSQILLNEANKSIQEAQKDMAKWTNYMAKDGLKNIMDMSNSGSVDLNKMGINQDVMNSMLKGMEDGSITIQDMLSGNIGDFAKSLGMSEKEAQKSVKAIMDMVMEQNDELSSALDLSIGAWTGSAQQNVDELAKAYDVYINSATKTLNQYNSVTGDLNKLLRETTKASKQTQKQIEGQTKEMVRATRATDGTSVAVKRLENKLIGANGKSGLFGSMVKLQKNMNYELQPAMVQTGIQTDILSGKTNRSGDQYKYMYKQSKSAYDQTRQFNSKNLSHTYNQFETISKKSKNVADKFTTMGRNADTAKKKTIDLAEVLSSLPGAENITPKTNSSGSKPVNRPHTTAYPTGYATGGYTGDWSGSGSNHEGRLAMLHEKELVLNKEDTKNILGAVSIQRKLMDNLSSKKAFSKNSITNKINENINNSSSSKVVSQNITLTPSFPNVKTAADSRGVFENLIAEANTFIGKNS